MKCSDSSAKAQMTSLRSEKETKGATKGGDSKLFMY